ncbi:MAG: phosphoenolpyruvate carboxykinase (GTP), partial [Kiritimatiellae bacterium]|nr:phosphoenolpyruvate carboxykinase (GTP) [Kiritimatiellia bacterium]
YFQHWLEMERTSADATKLPKIYFVNWFRKGDDGRFMWPGFGDNSRVLKWICQRIEGQVKANETAIGNLPFAKDVDLANNDEKAKFHVVKADLEAILKVDVEGWKKEIATIGASYDEYDAKASKDAAVKSATAKRVPKALRDVLATVTAALSK